MQQKIAWFLLYFMSVVFMSYGPHYGALKIMFILLYIHMRLYECVCVFVWLNAKMKPSRTQIRHAHHTQQAKCAKTFCIIQFLINKCSNFRAHFIQFALLNRIARKIENWSYLMAQNLTNNVMRAHQSKCVTRDRFQWICRTQSSNILCL